MGLKYCKTTFFAMTSFYHLLEINWFAETIFRYQDVDHLENNIPVTFDDWLMVRNTRGEEALANLAKISRKRIKVDL